MNTLEKLGYWWFPENPDKQIAGTLSFGYEARSELRLLDFPQDAMEAFFRQLGTCGNEFRPKIILGLSERGKKYTLYDCLRAGISVASASSVTQSFMPSVVIEGKHFACADDIVFHHMTARLSHLGEWYQRTGRHFESENLGDEKRKFTLSYEQPPSLTLEWENGRIELSHDFNIKLARFAGDFVISENACVSIYPDHPVHMLEFRDEWLPPVVHFITLGVGCPISLMEVRAKAWADCKQETEEGTKRAPSMHLYSRMRRYGDEDKELLPPNMVCTRPDLGDNIENFFKRWIQAYREIKPVMQLFFNRVLSRESFSVNSFLNSVQAAEAYHRYRRIGLDLPEDQHEKRVESIVAAAPNEYRQWLTDKLRHSNEIGLRRRLKEKLRERSDLFELPGGEINRLAHRIREIRNYFTHYSGEKDTNFATGRDLYVYDMLMQWVVTGCLLEEMGLTRDQVHQLIARNQAFLYFRSVHLKQQPVEIMKVISPIPEKTTDSQDTQSKDMGCE